MDDQYTVDVNFDAYNAQYVVKGPGLFMVFANEEKARMIAAALNNAYLLGRLFYLESKLSDTKIP